MKKLLPPTLLVMLALAMIASTFALPWPGFGWPVRLIGLVVSGVGLALSAQHAALFEAVGTNIKTFDDPDELVRDRAFSWSRNPMYLGFVLMLLGLAFALGGVVALAGPAAFFVAAERWYIPFEERRMAANFGADYEQYQLEVRRWVGRRKSAIGENVNDGRQIGENA